MAAAFAIMEGEWIDQTAVQTLQETNARLREENGRLRQELTVVRGELAEERRKNQTLSLQELDDMDIHELLGIQPEK